MTPVELIQDACSRQLKMADGTPLKLELWPPSSDTEITEFESQLPCPLPPKIRELLAYCRGFIGGSAADFVDFTGRDCLFEFIIAFPYGLPIAADGFGNFWVVDLWPDSKDWGPIYFACHDAPVILYQSTSLEDFLSEMFKSDVPPHKGLLGDVQEDRLFNIWWKNPGIMTQEECMRSPDRELRVFAEQLSPSFQIIDMRNAPVGFGYSWGRYGANTVNRRHGSLPIFAYERKKGLLSWIFGGNR